MLNTNKIPLSLYIHMPWCVQKCPYCDFNSHSLRDKLPESDYIQRLIEDFKHHQPLLDNRPIQTIFIGGGTPSLFSAKSYETLFSALFALHPFSENAEITLEANPNSVENAKFRSYRELGINRLSIGIQSFNDAHLQRLGRVHSASEAREAIENAQKAGFDNLNIDIMHGLQEQTVEESIDDLRSALSFKPYHLSWYQLTLEPNTLFYKKKPTLPDETTLHHIETEGKTYIKSMGLQQYEVSAYSLPSKACQHNLNYWRFGDYLGIGAGAHSKISSDKKIQRFFQYKSPQSYLSRPFSPKREILSSRQLPFEYFLNISRLFLPINFEHFLVHTGIAVKNIQNILEEGYKKNLICKNGSEIVLSSHGRLFLDDFVALFLK
jgi:putative oxygen-independent coproporphyrinogen III oxidase